jgi:hypothetical protein
MMTYESANGQLPGYSTGQTRQRAVTLNTVTSAMVLVTVDRDKVADRWRQIVAAHSDRIFGIDRR